MSGQLNLTALNASTTVTANKFVGDGSELTGVNTGNTAHGTLPSFSAWLNSASTTVNEGEVIPFNMTSFNNGDHYDASTTFKFTAPTKGQYTFVFSIGDVQSDNSVERIITFYKNGNVYRDAYNNNVNELGDADANAPVLLDLATGDTVDVRMRKGSITLDDGDLGAVNKPTFFGYKVGYGDGAMNVDYVYETLPAFRVGQYNASNFTLASAQQIPNFTVELFNNGSHFKTTGPNINSFVAPSTGLYSFGINFLVYDGDAKVQLRINGSNRVMLIQSHTQMYAGQGHSTLVSLNSGDVVDLASRTEINFQNNTVANVQAGTGNGIMFWGFKVGYGDGVSIKTFTKSGSVAFYNDGNVGIGTETPTAKLDVAGDIQATSIDVSSIGASLVSLIYPIGSIYITTSAVSPSVIWAGTTWVAYGEGRTLIGQGTGSGLTDRPTVEATGGVETHTLTVDEMPSHTHTFDDKVRGAPGALWAGSGPYLLHDLTRTISTVTTPNTTHSIGSSQAHPNMPPYIVTYMWKRTA